MQAEIDARRNRDRYETGFYRLPKHLDEEVARLHLEKSDLWTMTLSPKHADYIGVQADGP